MLEQKVRSIWSQVREEGGDGTSDAAEDRTAPSSTKLYNCPRCDVVYLALEKDVCSSCSGEVREVSTSLSHG